MLELRYSLYTIKKFAFKSIEQYTHRIKCIVDKLVATSITFEDEEVLIHAFNSLSPKFSDFHTSIRTQSREGKKTRGPSTRSSRGIPSLTGDGGQTEVITWVPVQGRAGIRRVSPTSRVNI